MRVLVSVKGEVFVAGWRHALRSEWPFIIIIIKGEVLFGMLACVKGECAKVCFSE